MRRSASLVSAVLAVGAAMTLVLASAAFAGTVTMNTCTRSEAVSSSWASQSGPDHNTPLTEVDDCAAGGRMQITGPKVTPGNHQGDYGQWSTTLPSAMALTGVSVPATAALINPATQNNGQSSGYHVRYMWGGGSVAATDGGNCCGGLDYANPVVQAIGGQYFIIQVACNGASAKDPVCLLPLTGSNAVFEVKDLTLTAADNAPPSVSIPPSAGSGTNLASAPHFVRGTFELAFTASNANASGVCGMAASINGTALPTVVTNQPNTTVWLQCPSSASWSQSVDTTAYPNGPLSIELYASDAASPANVGTVSRSLVVDNQPVALTVTGPADALSTAGTQFITASATAGPSGVQGIWCSLDGGPYVEHQGSAVQIPVSGVGSHQAACYAENSAVDASGTPARSATESFSMTIRQQTEAAISFTKLKNPLRCHHVTITTKTHSRTIVRHGHKVTVAGHKVRRRVLRCQARTVRRVVTVVVPRNGKPVRIREPEHIVVLPHQVSVNRKTVAFGQGATVSGVLLTSSHAPVAGQTVQILTAPDNGLHQWAPAATATTSATGTWTAHLAAGPSRLIAAQYVGSSTLEPTTSNLVLLSVPARIDVSITPRQLPWTGTLTVHGQLAGGYVPADGVALRLLVRYPKSKKATPLLALRTTSTGQFAITWSYHTGHGTLTVPVTVATTATESDYPYVASSSTPVNVTFGTTTPTLPPRSGRHHTGKRRR